LSFARLRHPPSKQAIYLLASVPSPALSVTTYLSAPRLALVPVPVFPCVYVYVCVCVRLPTSFVRVLFRFAPFCFTHASVSFPRQPHIPIRTYHGSSHFSEIIYSRSAYYFFHASPQPYIPHPNFPCIRPCPCLALAHVHIIAQFFFLFRPLLTHTYCILVSSTRHRPTSRYPRCSCYPPTHPYPRNPPPPRCYALVVSLGYPPAFRFRFSFFTPTTPHSFLALALIMLFRALVPVLDY